MPGDKLRLLDRIEILVLEVLLRADREHLLIADLAHDHGQQTRYSSAIAEVGAKSASVTPWALRRRKCRLPGWRRPAAWYWRK
jgi:hypothetical protein